MTVYGTIAKQVCAGLGLRGLGCVVCCMWAHTAFALCHRVACLLLGAGGVAVRHMAVVGDCVLCVTVAPCLQTCMPLACSSCQPLVVLSRAYSLTVRCLAVCVQ
jgi:hypothetical protein